MGKIRLTFVTISLIGILLPLISIILGSIIYYPIWKSEQRLYVIISICCSIPITIIPFLILGIFTKKYLNNVLVNNFDVIYFSKISGIIGALVILSSFSLFIFLAMIIYPTSTATIALLFIPFYGIIAIPIGYWIGKLVWYVVSKLKCKL